MKGNVLVIIMIVVVVAVVAAVIFAVLQTFKSDEALQQVELLMNTVAPFISK